MTAVNLSGLGAGGPLDGLWRLTALSDLRLGYNAFAGLLPSPCHATAVPK